MLLRVSACGLLLTCVGCGSEVLDGIDPGGGASTRTVVSLKRDAVNSDVALDGKQPETTASSQPVDLIGRFVIDGSASKLPSRFGKGGAPADPQICAKEHAIEDESLVLGAEGGIGNIFVYLDKSPKNAPAEDSIPDNPLLDQVGCVFKPHALVVRTGKTFPLKNSDPVTHNVKTNPGKNAASNNSMGGGETMSLSFKKSEKAPFESSCAIHAWMNFYTLVVDHPYATVSASSGEFVMKNLPAGEHQLRIWHERAGAIETRKVVVTGAGKIDLGDIKIPLAKFRL